MRQMDSKSVRSVLAWRVDLNPSAMGQTFVTYSIDAMGWATAECVIRQSPSCPRSVTVVPLLSMRAIRRGSDNTGRTALSGAST